MVESFAFSSLRSLVCLLLFLHPTQLAEGSLHKPTHSLHFPFGILIILDGKMCLVLSGSPYFFQRLNMKPYAAASVELSLATGKDWQLPKPKEICHCSQV